MGVKLGNNDISFKLGSGDCTVYLGETLIYSPEPSLPNVPFTVNYNAKNFDPATNTIAKETGQLADVDAVISGTVVSNGDYLTVSSGACASISGFSQYFNRSTSNESGTSLTIISKHKVGNSDDYCHLFSNRDGVSTYNWMYRTYPSIVQFHASSAHGGIPVTTQPVITSIRVEYVGAFDISYTYNNYTDNTTSAVTGNYSYGSDSNQANLFFGGYDDEYFAGDFYWIYITQNVLTDAQIQQVIEYNESLPTPPTPPVPKWIATYDDGEEQWTSSAECDGSSAITYNEITLTDLVSVEIMDCVTSIGVYAFLNCSGLTSCTIGSGVTSIGDAAFYQCSGLTSIDIPSGVISIDNYAFDYCTGLSSVVIGSGVTKIGSSAFRDCSGLTEVTINATTPPTLGGSAFINTNNCPIYVPSGSVDTYKAASGWSMYANRIQAIPTPTPQWVTFNSGDDISGLQVYGVKGTANDLYLTFNDVLYEDIFFDLSRNIVSATIGGGCYTNDYGMNDNVEIIFSNVGCSDYYTIPSSMTVTYGTIQLYIYQ